MTANPIKEMSSVALVAIALLTTGRDEQADESGQPVDHANKQAPDIDPTAPAAKGERADHHTPVSQTQRASLEARQRVSHDVIAGGPGERRRTDRQYSSGLG